MNTAASDVRNVTITLGGTNINVDPLKLAFKFGESGTVVWTINDANANFRNGGVIFPEASPFSPQLVSAKICKMAFNNSALDAVGTFKYDILLDAAGLQLTDDPTVQNDSPP